MQWKRPLIKQGMSYDRAPCTQAGGGLPLADPVAGFTLIEVIASLVLIGIMAVTVATALVHGMQGFVFTKENTAVAQKAQLAMHRLQRELTGLTDLDAEASGAHCIRYRIATESPYFRAIGLNGSNLELAASNSSDQGCPASGNPGLTLVDRVGMFTLQYEDTAGNVLSTPLSDLEDLALIRVQLVLNRADDNPATVFTGSINPRNNDRLNMPGG